ncbi:Prefoldin beta-like [Parasponia andersonii]|uniref:Prefoldin beta-like n=1 Tax=Parasponia andersonii TaxID=3476 RepID=A0A2P5C6H6_PARAD|nr:Prefoldin beta-like [Parasponia andersonii]
MMASTSRWSSSAIEAETTQKVELIIKEIRSHEVALAELNALSSSRPVYHKNGSIYFRTTIQKATSSEQKLLDQAKSRLDKLNSIIK